MRLTKIEEAEIRKMWKEGVPSRDIAEYIGCHEATVRRVKRRAGLEKRIGWGHRKKDMSTVADRKIVIAYTNYRGERSIREIVPEKIWFGSTEWHPGQQWLMRAYDLQKRSIRDFALADMELDP